MECSQLHVSQHPLVKHLLTEVRDEKTPPPRFRQLLETIGTLLTYEATSDLPLAQVEVDTPLESCEGHRLGTPVTLVPILRAGLGLSEGARAILPHAYTGHIGLYRNEQSLQPVSYYQKFPANVADGPVLLIDPMLATGGSAIAAISTLRQRGCKDIRMICLVAAPEGVAKVVEADADVPIYTASLDRCLNDQGYILPGLGDAGDRIFGTI